MLLRRVSLLRHSPFIQSAIHVGLCGPHNEGFPLRGYSSTPQANQAKSHTSPGLDWKWDSSYVNHTTNTAQNLAFLEVENKSRKPSPLGFPELIALEQYQLPPAIERRESHRETFKQHVAAKRDWALNQYAEYLLHGFYDIQQNTAKAVSIFETLAAKKNLLALRRLHHVTGSNTSEIPQEDTNASREFPWIDNSRGAERSDLLSAFDGDVEALIRAGVRCAKWGVKDSTYAKIVELLEKTAERDGRACHILAKIFEKRRQKSIEWYKRGAELEHPVCAYRMGVHCAMQNDHSSALGYYHRAAEKGFSRARRELAFIYEHGRGIPCDSDAAENFMLLAAEDGDSLACVKMANLYLQRSSDFCHKAMDYIDAAQARGEAQAYALRGNLFRTGHRELGIEPNLRFAYHYNKVAAERGNPHSALFYGRFLQRSKSHASRAFSESLQLEALMRNTSLTSLGDCRTA
jgi:TPR repeat protein